VRFVALSINRSSRLPIRHDIIFTEIAFVDARIEMSRDGGQLTAHVYLGCGLAQTDGTRPHRYKEIATRLLA